jgi:hypothetical protein
MKKNFVKISDFSSDGILLFDDKNETLIIDGIENGYWINFQMGKDMLSIPKSMIPDIITVLKMVEK